MYWGGGFLKLKLLVHYLILTQIAVKRQGQKRLEREEASLWWTGTGRRKGPDQEWTCFWQRGARLNQMQLGSQCFQESCLFETGDHSSILCVLIEFLLLSCTEPLGPRVMSRWSSRTSVWCSWESLNGLARSLSNIYFQATVYTTLRNHPYSTFQFKSSSIVLPRAKSQELPQ